MPSRLWLLLIAANFIMIGYFLARGDLGIAIIVGLQTAVGFTGYDNEIRSHAKETEKFHGITY